MRGNQCRAERNDAQQVFYTKQMITGVKQGVFSHASEHPSRLVPSTNLDGEIAVGLDLLGVVGIHDGLGRWANGNRLIHLRLLHQW